MLKLFRMPLPVSSQYDIVHVGAHARLKRTTTYIDGRSDSDDLGRFHSAITIHAGKVDERMLQRKVAELESQLQKEIKFVDAEGIDLMSGAPPPYSALWPKTYYLYTDDRIRSEVARFKTD